jgi:methylglutaconyl-CoA hydratase
MTIQTLTEEVDGRGVVAVTFNRPEKGNAYNQAMLDALHEVLTRHATDAATRVLVIRGAGKHFCAGADLSGHDATAFAPRITMPGLCLALDNFPKPTIAVVHGACIGGGLAFAACCDAVIAARDAFFSLPEVRLGFAPLPLVALLARAIHPRHLRRYLTSGERFLAADALRIGLVHELCDASEIIAAQAKAVASFLEAAPLAASAIKRELLARSGDAVTDELLVKLQAEFRRGTDSPEAHEGRAAFREKRRPSWAPKLD